MVVLLAAIALVSAAVEQAVRRCEANGTAGREGGEAGREAGRERDYPRESRVSIGRAPSSPSSTFTARGATPHGQRLRFSFSMISPSDFVEEAEHLVAFLPSGRQQPSNIIPLVPTRTIRSFEKA